MLRETTLGEKRPLLCSGHSELVLGTTGLGDFSLFLASFCSEPD